MILPVIPKLRYFCQRVLPLVYDDSLSYQELLYKVVGKINELIDTNDILVENFNSLNENFDELKEWCENYFASLDVTTQVNQRIDYLVRSGAFDDVVENLVADMTATEITKWLNQHITPTTPPVDNTLTVAEAAADAKAAGNRIRTTESLTGLRWYNGYYQTSNHQYVAGTTDWKTSNPMPCQAGDTIYYCGHSSQTVRQVFTWFDGLGAQIGDSEGLGEDYTEVSVTVPEGAEFFRVLARSTRLADTYVTYGANPVQNPMYWDRRRIVSLETETRKRTECYVDCNAEPGGDGRYTRPFQTIGEARLAGYKLIHCRPGIYPSPNTQLVNDRYELDMWSNDSYDMTNPDKEKVIIFSGDKLTGTLSGGQLSAAYTPPTDRRFYKVLVSAELPCIDESYTYALAYNVDLFLWKPGHKSRRYEPVLPLEYTGREGTFTYQGGNVVISPWATDEGLTDIYISHDPARPFTFTNSDIKMRDVVIMGAWFNGIAAYGGRIELTNCDFICTSHGTGFSVSDGDAYVNGCFGSGNCADAFGAQAYGYSEFIDCKAYWSGDDGISHHDGTKGLIIGGEYCDNVSGGITPAFGAEINIIGAVTLRNGVGLQFFGASGRPKRKVYINGCISKDNITKDIYNSGYDLVGINCIYDSEQATSGNTNTFYSV